MSDKHNFKRKHIYVHETETLWVDNGELHIICDNGHIVWNMETLYNDLPHFLDFCIQEHKKKEKRVKDEIGKLINYPYIYKHKKTENE